MLPRQMTDIVYGDCWTTPGQSQTCMSTNWSVDQIICLLLSTLPCPCTIYCLLSCVYFPLSIVISPLSIVYCLMYIANCLVSAFYSPRSTICYLLLSIDCMLSTVCTVFYCLLSMSQLSFCPCLNCPYVHVSTVLSMSWLSFCPCPNCPSVHVSTVLSMSWLSFCPCLNCPHVRVSAVLLPMSWLSFCPRLSCPSVRVSAISRLLTDRLVWCMSTV